MKQKLWFGFLLFVLLFGGCGATSTQSAAPQPEQPIKYYSIDGTTTIFTPDRNADVLCFYVESMKSPQASSLDGKDTIPAVFTSGLACIQSQSTHDYFVEKYRL